MSERIQSFGGEEIKEESSWRYPLLIFLATLSLSVVFLFYYLGPRLDDIAGDTPKPTISDETIAMQIGDVALAIPANHTVFPRARRGGERQFVALYALWPNMSPYSPGRRRDFTENAPNTRRIDIHLESIPLNYTETQRFERIYLPLTENSDGEPTSIGLTRYTFQESRPDTPQNAYRDEELFVARTDNGAVVFRCFRELEHIKSPDCRRDLTLPSGLSVTYRFKRPHLDRWRDIDAAVQSFIAELTAE